MMECSDQGTLLNDPITIGELFQNGVTFSLESNFEEDQPNVLIDDELTITGDSENEMNENVLEAIISPCQSSFHDLKKRMVKCNENLFKRIITEGDKNSELCPDNARVIIEYNGYWENQAHPFDSTFLRGKNLVFHSGRGEILEGLEAAVITMREKEEAHFIISYKLLYLEIGCPPQIPPKADAFFTIKLLKYTLVGDENALEEVAPKDRRDFALVFSKVKEIHLKGLDDFREMKYSSACRAFHKAITALEWCDLKTQEEKTEQKNFLVKLFTNLTVCYNKMNKPDKICSMCDEIRKLTDINYQCKALFQEGRALICLGKYSLAKQRLQAAQRLEPFNLEISNELRVLSHRCESYTKTQQNFCQKAIGLIKLTDEEAHKPYVFDETEEKIAKFLNQFKAKKDATTYPLPDGLVFKEIESIKRVANAIGLIFMCENHFGKNKYIIKKKTVN